MGEDKTIGKVKAAMKAGEELISKLRAFDMGDLEARPSSNVITLIRKVNHLNEKYFDEIVNPPKADEPATDAAKG